MKVLSAPGVSIPCWALVSADHADHADHASPGTRLCSSYTSIITICVGWGLRGGHDKIIYFMLVFILIDDLSHYFEYSNILFNTCFNFKVFNFITFFQNDSSDIFEVVLSGTIIQN